MDKLKMETEDLTSENIEKLKELFPSVVSDGKIDFDKLKQELSADIVKTVDSYDFTWVGKHEAVRKANEPVNAVLRPCPEESKNWEKTKNIYIEGDNLDVLKVLYKSYAGQIKMIYIDPPYNRGSDLIYNDTFTQNAKEYSAARYRSDEQGNQLEKNTDTSGRYHSKWCSMMYPRLKIARKLLSESGVIFISIDDNEQTNLKKICDEIFGENNFISEFVWKCRTSLQHTEPLVSKQTERVLLYVKNKMLWYGENNLYFNRIRKPYDATEYKNPDNDPRGPWLSSGKTRNDGRPSYTVTSPTGVKFTKPWIPSPAEFKRWEDEKLIWWGINGDSIPRKKSFLKDFKGNAISDIIFDEYLVQPIDENSIKRTKIWEIGTTESGTKSLKELFDGNSVFPYPKPDSLIKYFAQIATLNDDIILDFFSGSATTAHAVMQLNAEDGGNRKFIMVQVPEPCDEKSEYKNICEIGKERIRRAGEKIVADTGRTDLDIGFRVFKLDSSNMKDVYFTPDELIQKEGADIEDLADNVKPDRTPADLLFGVMQYWNMTECLGLPHATKEIDGRTIHIIQDGQFPELVACFDADVPETVIKEMAALKPLRAVFRERCFKTTQDRLNAERLLKNADIRLI